MNQKPTYDLEAEFDKVQALLERARATLQELVPDAAPTVAAEQKKEGRHHGMRGFFSHKH